jgi:anti-anti-sigma factor
VGVGRYRAVVDLVCRTVVIGSTPTLQMTGEIDLASVPVFHDAMRRIIADHRAATIAVDLDGVTVLDDVGLGVLLGAAGRAREAGGDLVVVCTSERLRRRFDVTGLARAVDVRDRLAP